MAKARIPLGHCSRCGSPPTKRSGIRWCAKCNEEIRGFEIDPSRQYTNDAVTFERGKRIVRRFEDD